jgi:hypothetical protein
MKYFDLSKFYNYYWSTYIDQEFYMLAKVRLIISIPILFALISCGGGGGSGSTSSTNSTSAISGTAATGAPITNAVVNIYDANGKLVGTTTTDSGGAYSLAGIDVNSHPGPYVIEVTGGVGDSVTTLYSISATTGTANVSQISNAIVATIAKGDPSSLTAGNTATASSIGSVDSAYQGALSTISGALNATGSLISQKFNTNFDGLLDSVLVNVNPNGSVEMGTATGLSMPELGDPTATSATSVKLATIANSSLPDSALASLLPAATGSELQVTAAMLEPLRAQLQKCFSNAAASRITLGGSLSSNHPAWSGLNADCAGLDDGSFKHESYYWIDGLSANSTAIPSTCANYNAFCLGFFGAMLRDSTYDNLQFLKPRNIRVIGNNLYHVQFPVMYCDDASQSGVTCGPNGSRGQFGDVIGSVSYAVIKYDSVAKTFTFHGNQRDVQSYMQAAVQRVQLGSTNKYRFESAFNTYINPYSSRTLKPSVTTSIYPVKTVITALNQATGMLPTGGVTLANKLSRNNATTTSNITSPPNSGLPGAVIFNVCNGYLSLENPATLPSPIRSYNANTTNAAPCAGLLRMGYREYTRDPSSGLYTPAIGAYPITSSVMTSPALIVNYNDDGSIAANARTWDSVSFTARTGEKYLFTITMSDGTTLNYINRLSHTLIPPDDLVKLDYPEPSADTITAFSTFNGSSSASFSPSWTAMKRAYVFQDVIMWNRGEADSRAGVKVGSTSNNISCSSYNSGLSTPNITVGSAVNSDPLNCKDPNNWVSGANGAAVDSGILQLKARRSDGIFVSTQVRQY